MNIDNILIAKKSVYIVLLSIFFILLLPLIAMQFTSEVNWGVGDFAVAGVLLSFFGYLFKVLTKSSNNQIKNIIMGMLVFCLLFSVWVSLI